MAVVSTALAMLLAQAAATSMPAASPLPAPDASAEVIKARVDQQQRMTVPVRIGEQGPFHFVVDTGSQTTVFSTDIAAQLSIPATRQARIIGVGGIGTVGTAIVDRVSLGRRSFDGVEVALLEAENIGSDGIVGIDSLQQQRVMLDFSRNRMTVGDARSTGGNSGFEIVVNARRRRGQLIMTDALIDGIRTDVVIDTGANTSVGNRALQNALNRRQVYQKVTLIDVTGTSIVADIGFPRKLTISSIAITNLQVAYADTPVFEVLGLNKRPALMLGMRELRLFKRIAIDFSTRRVYFDLPG